MGNSFAVRTYLKPVDEVPVSQEMPSASPALGGLHPGAPPDMPPQPGRRAYPRGMKNLPWRSWLNKGKPGIKRKKRGKIGALMG